MSKRLSEIQVQPNARNRKRARQSFYQALQKSAAGGGIPSLDIGERLRSLRSERGLTLRMLAELSGLNTNTLSMIENSRTSPSIGTLQQIAYGLQLPLSAFFETEKPTKDLIFLTAGQRSRVSFTYGMLEELGSGMTSQSMQPFLIHLQPKAESGPVPIVHPGLELVYCLEGCLEYQVRDTVYELSPGDSLVFEAHLPHRWQNKTDLPSRLLLVLCAGGDDDQHIREHFSPLGGE